MSARTPASSGHQIAEPASQAVLSRGMPSIVARSPEWAPAVDARVVRIGTWMWIGADALFFVAWFFAFFYLRALNNNHDFQTIYVVHPRRYMGGIIVLLIVAAAGLYWLGSRALANRRPSGRIFLWLALVAGILCIGFQIYEFGHLGFDPQLGGGYSSVFVGLKGAWFVQLVGAVLWMGTQVAQSRAGGDMSVRPASAAMFSYFLAFLAGINLIAYLVLYFV
jgi:heme/copper-type cytochrome/quinol oxidase subunit 3